MKYEEYIGNGSRKTRRPAEIESDLASIRSEMSDTLQKLEARFSPRALLEQLFSRVRGVGEGSSEMAENLGATLRDNPVPVLLLAAGAASLLASERFGAGRSRTRDEGDTSIGERLEEWEHSGHGHASSITDRAREVAGKIGERASHLRERTAERAGAEHQDEVNQRHALRERASAVRERAGELRQHARERGAVVRERMHGGVMQARDYGSRTLQDEPLVVIGLGLAIGAIFGASTPVSERERRALHTTGERVLQRSKHAAQSGADQATRAVRAVSQEFGAAGKGQSSTQSEAGRSIEVDVDVRRDRSDDGGGMEPPI